MNMKSRCIAMTAMMIMSGAYTSAFAEDGGLRQLEKTQAQLAERQEKTKNTTEEQMVKETETAQEESTEQKS